MTIKAKYTIDECGRGAGEGCKMWTLTRLNHEQVSINARLALLHDFIG
jgi:hypothetical protein